MRRARGGSHASVHTVGMRWGYGASGTQPMGGSMTRGRSSNGARTPQVRHEPVPEDGAEVLSVRPQGALFQTLTYGTWRAGGPAPLDEPRARAGALPHL